MKRVIKEKHLFRPVCNLFSGYKHLSEFPFKGKSIDLLFFKKRKGRKRLVAVELKLKKWKKALRQASVYQLCSNKVYIGLLGSNFSRKMLDVVSGQGVGVIGIDLVGRKMTAKIIRKPKSMPILNKAYLDDVMQTAEYLVRKK